MPFGGLLTVGLIAGGTGLAGSLIAKSGSDKAAAAAGSAAEAQQRMAEAQLEAARQQRADALEASKPSASEADAMNRQFDATQRAIARQQALLDATDPALIEAGSQALKMLRGQESSTLAPARAERDRQRSQLVNEIQKRLGPGGLDSSSGQAALNKFDQQTQLTLGELQQKSLDRVLGVTQAVRPNPYGEAAAENSIRENFANLSNRKISAINATPITPYYNPQYAGAPFLQAALEGKGTQSLGNSIGSLGGTLGGLALSGAAGGFSAPKSPTTAPSSNYLFSPEDLSYPDLMTGVGHANA